MIEIAFPTRSRESAENRPIDPTTFTNEQRQHIFDTALTKWQRAFKPRTIKSFLSDTKLPEAQMNELKIIRRKGQQLATLYRFFDERGAIPEQYADLLRAMGNIKDAQTVNHGKRYKATAQEYGGQVRQALRQIEAFDQPLDLWPVNDGTYRERIKDTLKKINHRASQENLPITKFHKMRKDIRAMSFLLDLAAETKSIRTVDHVRVSAPLTQLSEELGIIHDNIVGLSLNGQEKYERAMAQIDKRQRNAIRKILSDLGHKGNSAQTFDISPFK